MIIARNVLSFAMLAASASAACVPSETNVCMSIDFYASETGLYNLDRGDSSTDGPSPDLTVKIGQTITFDQTDVSNWYHPVGFAYAPDGAHGDDWGADENPEVEGADQLTYKINGEVTTCEDVGTTGLDCYEPEFFYPYGDWQAKGYSAELTITQELADASNGGVLYYFCHIHSKMSGKIIIKKSDGTDYVSASEELELYSPPVHDAFDVKCGTTGIAHFADGGEKQCGIKFLPGVHDTDYEKCLQAIDCQMTSDMYSETAEYAADAEIVSFMQQMIPHHQNAVNMAKLLMKHGSDIDDELDETLRSIINVQNYQIHSFRNYLHPEKNYLDGSNVVPPIALSDASDDGSHDSHDGSHDSHSDDSSVARIQVGVATFLAMSVGFFLA